jgi:hypothetical protein
MTQYFVGLTDVTDIKKRYKDLAKQHHPDLGGDTATMQDINSQYHDALKGNHQKATSDGHTYYYNLEVEQAIIDQLGLILTKLNPFIGVNVWLVGKWVWIDGDTKPAKDALKDLGCRWAPKHCRWYWRHESHRSRGNGGSFYEIATKYGVSGIKDKQDKKLATAV